MIAIPELELLQILKRLLVAFEIDYTQATDKSKTVLAGMFQGLTYQDRDLEKEAIALFITNSQLTQNASNRKVSVHNYYSRSKVSPPSIHITAPNEEPFANSFGVGRGNMDPVFDGDSVSITKQRSYKQRHAIIFTSDNHIEVQLMYFTVKYLLISMLDELILGNFQNPSFTGTELRLDDSQKAPENFYMRSLIIDSFYELNILPLVKCDSFKKILFPRSNDSIGGEIGDIDLDIIIEDN